MTEEEKEERLPFWAKTYMVGKKEFRFERKFIDKHMNNANALINDNASAYHDYKKRELFPKMSDNDQAHLRTMNR